MSSDRSMSFGFEEGRRSGSASSPADVTVLATVVMGESFTFHETLRGDNSARDFLAHMERYVSAQSRSGHRGVKAHLLRNMPTPPARVHTCAPLE